MVRHVFRFGSLRMKFFVACLVLLFFVAIFLFSFSLRTPKYALLSFDVELVDGKESVAQIVDFIVSHNLRAEREKRVNVTFFMTGEYALKNRDVVKRIVDEGFEIACHSFSHPVFLGLNVSQKTFQITMCRNALEIAKAPKPVGFRAPYTLIDGETLDILERRHFVYDSSTLSYTDWIYGDDDKTLRIPVSTVGLIPLEDVTWVYYLRMPSAFFWLLRHQSGDVVTMIFHPHHAVKHLSELEASIEDLSARNVTFISYYHFAEVTDGDREGFDRK